MQVYLSGSASVCHAQSGARSPALLREERRKGRRGEDGETTVGVGKGHGEERKGKEEHTVKGLLTKPRDKERTASFF